MVYCWSPNGFLFFIGDEDNDDFGVVKEGGRGMLEDRLCNRVFLGDLLGTLSAGVAVLMEMVEVVT